MVADRDVALNFPAGKERIASCGCGGLKAALRGEPADVYVCSCEDCQKRSGGAFTYAAIFPEPNVTVTGEYRSWRRNGEAGRWIENSFCPACGVAVFFHSEAMPGLIGIPVGCLSESEFPRPARHYWSSRKHHWLELPADIPRIETQ